MVVNQVHNTITNAAFLYTPLIMPSSDPTMYIGTNIFVAGSKTVKVSTALAPIKKTASTISHQNAIGLDLWLSLKKLITLVIIYQRQLLQLAFRDRQMHLHVYPSHALVKS